jgi:hypothetical protein
LPPEEFDNLFPSLWGKDGLVVVINSLIYNTMALIVPLVASGKRPSSGGSGLSCTTEEGNTSKFMMA